MKRIGFATLCRREFFRAAVAGALFGAAGSTAADAAAARPAPSTEKRKSRYKGDAAEVQNFYRVARYPAG
jgi:hypothetical protein